MVNPREGIEIVSSLLQEQTCIKTCFPSQILGNVTKVTSTKKNTIEKVFLISLF